MVLEGLGLSSTSAWRQKQAQLTRASSDGSCVTSKLLRNDRRTPVQVRKLHQELDLVFGPNARFRGLHRHRLVAARDSGAKMADANSRAGEA